MKPWLIVWGGLMLTGCAQPPQPKEQVLQEDSPPSCVASLSQLEAQAYAYVRAFQACEEPVTNDELVRRYVQALIASGQYQTLLEGTAFSETVDAELAQYWTDWARDVL
jgi:hypothetical protein